MARIIVVEPFAGYQKGDEITDAAEVQTILDGENAAHVLRAPDAPAE